jgi:hypothetical protein
MVRGIEDLSHEDLNEEWIPMTVPHQEQTGPSATSYRSGTYQSRPAGWVVGMSVFAAIVIITIGFFHAVQGLAALFRNEIYVVGAQYVFSFDLTAWGWIHLLLGILLIVAGFSIRSGRVWARSVGVGFAVLSMIANFLFLPYYPVWSVLIITLDVFVIWALCLYSAEDARE